MTDTSRRRTFSQEKPPAAPFHLSLKLPGERRRPARKADAVVHLEERPGPGLRLHHNLGRLWPLPPDKKGPVLGFLLIALGVWAADKLAPRRPRPDGWSRDLTVEVPLPSPWPEVAPSLGPFLNFLTGDTWTLRSRSAAFGLCFAKSWPHAWQPTAVALFSGGLDSLIGAIDLLEQGHRLVLVSHYDYGQLAAGQQTLAAALLRHYGSERLCHLALRLQLEGPELTLRSRSLLYMALGLVAVSAFSGTLPLFLPENGWISLNPPLTLNRLGTYSTRTTHPAVLRGITSLWRQAGLFQELLNPYRHLTKGEAVAQCTNLSLLRELAPLSISCARPVAGRWQKKPGGACGYCYPCLVRRAALHRLGWDRGRDYRVDVLAEPLALRHRVKGRNLRALCLALKPWESNSREILGRLAPGPGEQEETRWEAAEALRLVEAGFLELGAWIRDQGGAGVREFLGEIGPGG